MLRLRLKIWERGVLIAVEINLRSSILIPSRSWLFLDSNVLRISQKWTGPVCPRSSCLNSGRSLRYLSGVVTVGKIFSEILEPIFVKKLLNSSAISWGSVTSVSLTVIFSTFVFLHS